MTLFNSLLPYMYVFAPESRALAGFPLGKRLHNEVITF